MTSRKLAAASTDLLVYTLWVGVDEFPGVALHECCLNFLVGGVGLAHKDVFLDGRVEEHGLLADITNLLTVVAKVDALQILAVNQHLTGRRVVETLD